MLTNQKCLAGGSILKKIERFSNQGVERYFCTNDEEIAKVISRLNQDKNAENWLSMRPHNQSFGEDKDFSIDFGEFEKDRLRGRGIRIHDGGCIEFGYWENGKSSTGHHIEIYSGWFKVGGEYIQDMGID